jgi:transcriptional regulator with XRE-family HTH domain
VRIALRIFKGIKQKELISIFGMWVKAFGIDLNKRQGGVTQATISNIERGKASFEIDTL